MHIKQGVMDGLEQWEPEKGTPQGAVVSPLLANIYLNKIDHAMSGLGYEMVRYADDVSYCVFPRKRQRRH
jgi:RNA-directed DNA polymerase